MRVAVLGTGLLGRAVAERLQATGHTVTVYNRTRAKAEPLQSLGITVARSAADAMREADCTLLFLTDTGAIRSLVVMADAGASLVGQTIVQMGTIGPGESRDLYHGITGQGGDYLEAPVLGSIAEAKAGALLLMVGGTQEQLQRLSPVFRALSKKPRLVGPVGQAAALKLAFNQLIAAETAAFSLSLALVQRAHVPVELFMSILKESALFAPTFEKKFPRLNARHYDDPNFSTRHLLKDVELFLAVAKEQGVRTAGLHGVRDILSDAISHGHGEEDYSVLYEEINPRATSG